MQVDPPFTTNNAGLAFALYLAGVPWADERMPFRNEYTRARLASLGLEGMNIEAAVRLAVHRGQKGNVEYGFRRVDYLGELTAAFDDVQKRMEDEEGSFATMATEAALNLVAGRITPMEAIIRIACLSLKARQPWLDEWKSHIPWITLEKNGAIKTQNLPTGGTIETRPGWISYPLNASPTVKEHLGVSES